MLKFNRFRLAHRLSLLLTLAVLLVGPTALVTAQESEDQSSTQPGPLDPLTPEERAQAQRIAEGDARVKRMLGEGAIRLISAEAIIARKLPPEKLDRSMRQVQSILYRPQGEAGAMVVVDLRAKSIIEATRLRPDQVPLTSDDLADAFKLASRDPEVRKRLGTLLDQFKLESEEPGRRGEEQNLVTGLPIRSSVPKDPCSKHRCMELFFRRGTDYLSEPIIVVDLNSQRVTIEKRRTK